MMRIVAQVDGKRKVALVTDDEVGFTSAIDPDLLLWYDENCSSGIALLGGYWEKKSGFSNL